MLTKMRIQCSGNFPEPTNTIAFRMTDGTVRHFDRSITTPLKWAACLTPLQ